MWNPAAGGLTRSTVSSWWRSIAGRTERARHVPEAVAVVGDEDRGEHMSDNVQGGRVKG